MAERLRLDWIEYFLIRLSRPLAIYARYRRLASIPVFHGPPHLLESITEIPGVYPELGHGAFSENAEIGLRLEQVVKTRFDARAAHSLTSRKTRETKRSILGSDIGIANVLPRFFAMSCELCLRTGEYCLHDGFGHAGEC